MSYKIAVATEDGKTIALHFGRCAKWSIVEAQGTRHEFLEFREMAPFCGDSGKRSEPHLQSAVELLSDCRSVLACRIGPCAEAALKAHGITPFEYDGFVHEALDKLTAYYARGKEI